MSKLTASSLFYMPCQAQAGGKSFCEEYKAQAIAVDQMLTHPIMVEGPSLPTYSKPIAPAVVTGCAEGQTTWDLLPVKAKKIYDSMVPGDRSYKAQQLAGIVKAANISPIEKQALLASLALGKGVDKSAIRSARQYMGLP